MTLQAFKAAEFETSALRVIPVTPGKISRFEQLPLLSYTFADANGAVEKVFYHLERRANVGSFISVSQLHTVAKRMLDAAAEMGVHLHEHTSSYYNEQRDFLAQTMQNLIRRAAASDSGSSGRGDASATIRGSGGHIHAPLPQGATLRIFPSTNAQLEMGPYPRWDCILKGDMVWFGNHLPFAVYHAHCQGFEFENIIGFADECQKVMVNSFPWLEGHICFDRIGVETNPVSHQDEEGRKRG